MNILASSILFAAMLLTLQGKASVQGAELHFDSACDFEELTMDILTGRDVNPGAVTLHIILEPTASTRMAQVTRNHMNQNLTLYINGSKINTATIRAELNTGSFQVGIDKSLAEKIFPRLLETQCHQVN